MSNTSRNRGHQRSICDGGAVCGWCCSFTGAPQSPDLRLLLPTTRRIVPGWGRGVVGPEEVIVGGAGSYRPSPCPCRPSAARRPRRGSPASEASLTCAASSPPIVCRPLTPIGRSRLQPCSSSHLCSQWRLRVTRWNLSLSKAYDARAKR
jgi:hypothetical protein